MVHTKKIDGKNYQSAISLSENNISIISANKTDFYHTIFKKLNLFSNGYTILSHISS